MTIAFTKIYKLSTSSLKDTAVYKLWSTLYGEAHTYCSHVRYQHFFSTYLMLQTSANDDVRFGWHWHKYRKAHSCPHHSSLPLDRAMNKNHIATTLKPRSSLRRLLVHTKDKCDIDEQRE